MCYGAVPMEPEEPRGYIIDLLVAAAKRGLVRPEISLIAREAGVSPQSVRHVLMGAKCVTPSLREKVLRVVVGTEGAG